MSFCKSKGHTAFFLFFAKKSFPRFIVLFASLLFSLASESQTIGEYRTRYIDEAIYQWNIPGNWEIYNGTAWNQANAAQGFPGQYSIPPGVTVRTSSQYRYNTTTIIGNFTVNGTLTFSNTTDRTLTVNNNLSGTGSVNINQTGRSHIINLNGEFNAIGTFASTTTGVVNYGRNGNQQVFASANYGTLHISGSENKTLQGSTNVLGNLNILSGLLEAGSHNFMVSGTTIIGGEFSDLSNNGANRFVGLITINTAGKWNTLGSGNSSNLDIRGGITNNNPNLGSFLANNVEFLVENQELSGNGPMEFEGYVYIAQNRTLTNNNTSAVTIVTRLNGQVEGSIWAQGPNSHLIYLGSVVPMNIGTFDADAPGNTVQYSNIETSQPIAGTTYHNLIIGGTGTKYPNTHIVVNENLSINSGILGLTAFSYNLTVHGITNIGFNSKLDFGTTILKTVILRGNLNAPTGIIEMTGEDVPHNLYLSGESNSLGSFLTTGNSGSSVFYNRPGNQQIFPSTIYNNLIIQSGGNKSLSGYTLARTALTMTNGNILSNGNVLELGTEITNPGILNYTAGNITGQLKRWHNATGNYLFPVGTTSNDNHINLYFSSLTPGSITAEFIPNDPGSTGLPMDDIHDGLRISEQQYTDGYWLLTATGGLASSNFNIILNADGFTDFNSSARIIRRTGTAGYWTTDGVPIDPIGTNIRRNNLTSGISPSETNFGIGKIIVRITDQPDPVLNACIGSDIQFSVTAEAKGILTYQWYKVGSPDIQLSDPVKYPEYNTNTLTITNLVVGDAGEYYCTVSDVNSSVQSNNAILSIDLTSCNYLSGKHYNKLH